MQETGNYKLKKPAGTDIVNIDDLNTNSDIIDRELANKAQKEHTHSNYVNQNAFSNVAVGSTTIAADNATDTLTLAAGSNVTLTPDAAGDKVTISATDTKYTVATANKAGLVKSGTDITVDSNGNVSVVDDSHNHVISNVDGLQSVLDGKAPSSHIHQNYMNQNAEVFDNTKSFNVYINAGQYRVLNNYDIDIHDGPEHAYNSGTLLVFTSKSTTNADYKYVTQIYLSDVDNEDYPARYRMKDGDMWSNWRKLYDHRTGNGNEHIPFGGSDGSILVWNSIGRAKWHAIGNSALNCLRYNTASNIFGPTTSFSGFNTSYSAMENKINSCEYSLFLGTLAGISSPNGSDITCIGNNANVTGSHQVQLGSSGTTTYTYGSVQNRSDRRDKADVENTDLGLEFIKKLRPVKFRWNYREDYTEYIETQQENGEVKLEKIEHENDGSKKRKRFHQGLIAQEVKEVMDELGVDFAGYQDHSINGGKDILSIGYEELIPVLIKAVQEQQQQIDDLTRIIREK